MADDTSEARIAAVRAGFPSLAEAARRREIIADAKGDELARAAILCLALAHALPLSQKAMARHAEQVGRALLGLVSAVNAYAPTP